jgi:hypothetical protein
MLSGLVIPVILLIVIACLVRDSNRQPHGPSRIREERSS